MSSSGRWLHRPRPLDQPRARLVCFPHAGRGPHYFRPWVPLLPADVELCAIALPGRESRFAEPAPRDVDEVMAHLVAAVAPVVADTPAAFFGHSLGALLAFELSRRLASRAVAPKHLLVSGCRPPHLPDPAPIADLPDADFVDALRCLRGTAPEILSSPDALGIHLPVLRADFRLSEGYLCDGRAVLSCPITVLVGAADPLATSVDLARWAEQTTGECRVRTLPGNHFFVDSARALAVAAAVQPLLGYLID